MLRAHGVVGKFVEFFGPGLQDMPLANRATIANMAPEYGATVGFFPVDDETLRYLELTGRESYTISGIATDLTPGKRLDVTATAPDGTQLTFQVKCRIDTPIEVDYYRHGGILQYVLRDVMQA